MLHDMHFDYLMTILVTDKLLFENCAWVIIILRQCAAHVSAVR
jgi:hypothetical protein